VPTAERADALTLPKGLHNLALQTFFFGRHELQSHTGLAGATRPTAAMDVGVAGPRQLEVHHVVDFGDVQSSRSHVCCQQDSMVRFLEAVAAVNQGAGAVGSAHRSIDFMRAFCCMEECRTLTWPRFN
jgi:hypothetical protein